MSEMKNGPLTRCAAEKACAWDQRALGTNNAMSLRTYHNTTGDSTRN